MTVVYQLCLVFECGSLSPFEDHLWDSASPGHLFGCRCDASERHLRSKPKGVTPIAPVWGDQAPLLCSTELCGDVFGVDLKAGITQHPCSDWELQAVGTRPAHPC